jgi:hypothetical protein
MVIIDFHTHVFSPKLIANRENYVAADPCFARLYSSKKAKLGTSEDLIDEMDACGVDKSVILNIGWSSHDLCVGTNDYILESAVKFPGRLIPFVGIQPLAGADAIREIERCAAAGARGVGELRPDVQGLDLGDRRVIQPFVKALVERKLILLCHTDEPAGHTYPGKGATTPEALYPFIAGYPELKLVLAHWGGGLPFYALMPEVSDALKNVWFDSAASPYLYRSTIYERVADLVGTDKILFGSDWPLLSQRRGSDEMKALGLPQATADKILGGNAAALLGG